MASTFPPASISARFRFWIVAIAACPLLLAGCGQPPAAPETKATGRAAAGSPAATNARRAKSTAVSPKPVEETSAEPVEPSSPVAERSPEPPRRTLGDLLDDADDNRSAASFSSAPLPLHADGPTITIDDGKVAVAGIRKLVGEHFTLYTDVPGQSAVDELPAVFDAAVPLWSRYFDIDLSDVADWHITGFLMQERNRFAGADLFPAGLPPFRNGFQWGRYIWLYDQTDDYYRRHLLLHEGTHAFMNLILGSLGPAWYAEGMAELLGTHRWQDGRLQLAYLPQDKEETPGWGRVKIVRDELQAGRGMMPASIMNYGPQAHLQNEPYGWCWALAAFLEAHPAYRERFRALRHRVCDADFTQSFQQQLAGDWRDLEEQWQVFVMDLDYGYDVPRAAIERKAAQPLPPGGATVTIAADRGWQSTGIRLEAATAYRLVASGRYQVAETSDIWWCEPNGVTIRYHGGRPLGLLLGAVRDDSQTLQGLSPLTRPEPVGLSRQWSPETSGTLYLKINESAAGLADNQGQLTVRIEAIGA